MIILAAITDSIQAKLSGAIVANHMPILSSFRDVSETVFTPGRGLVLTNDTTYVTCVAAPASGEQRVVDYISITNLDTAANVVTIKYDANGTEYVLYTVSLGPGETLDYNNGSGWKVYANSGAVKTSQNQGNSPASSEINVAVLGSDVTNNNAVANTIADVTGLSFPVTSGNRYWFRFFIEYSAAATSTGSRWAINGPAITRLAARSRYSLGATSETLNVGITAYDTPAAASASSLLTGNTAIIEGIIQCSANGTVIARFASEILSSAITAKAGSYVQWIQLS